ncbi:CARDB domain-containing protein [Hyalangium rubrum]|uniref:CARDB domain-containing protein n=1 Tax=Hyalangium rubrum TaxID=3103134 RepID=A0ABU5HGW3_9BACT|nr:CARDB domain-containing protein [Hyalangium sp. s54d21]MDY7232701.1 CARDB domain-containing protein [Hyalangium sp. s54d21]
MHMPKWWLGALAGALVGCSAGPYPGDPDFDTEPGGWDGPGAPSDTGMPDFQLELVTGPSELGANTATLLRARLCNRGEVEASTEVAFFLSLDNVIDERDEYLSTSMRVPVSAGYCRDASARAVMPSVGEGSYFLGAIVDPQGRVSEVSESNNQRGGGRILVDITAPAAPVLAWTTQGSGIPQLPQLSVQTEANATVRIYGGGSCQGMPLADSATGSNTYCEVPLDLPSYSVISYSARAYDFAGNASSCTNIPAPAGYGNTDTTPPAPPVLVETNWSYGTTQHQLFVRGTAEPLSEVGIFVDVQCTGNPVATVSASANGTFSATLTVAATGVGSIRRVFVAARDAALNESTCIGGPTYETPCPQGYANCDGNPANGCEVDLTSDADHCGTCGTTCPDRGNAEGVCVASTCGIGCPVGTYDCDGNAANGCESTQACGPASCTIDRSEELVITSLSVVEDMIRTPVGGAWHFETLMRSLAGGQDPSPLVRQWLRTWTTTQTINGLTVPARPQMMTKVLGPWEELSGGPNQPLNFAHAPFRLLAIVNRMDLRQPGVQAGEGRFVFGVLDPNGNPLEFTVIFEYALPGTTPEAIQAWAHDWHELGQLGLSHPDFKMKLHALTNRFAKEGVMPGRPHGSALNQIRTNEVALGEPWEMREFVLTTSGLQPATVKLTPDNGFQNTNTLSSFINANQADILAEQHTVPERFSGQRFLGASSKVPENFFWRAPSVNTEARHKFSLNTCNGCHAGETGTDFVHIANRAEGQLAVLSPFLRGGTVQDPVTRQTRQFDDLGRRAQDLATLVCGTPATGIKGSDLTFESLLGYPAPSNLPRARVH